jgi:hypothetical protein
MTRRHTILRVFSRLSYAVAATLMVLLVAAWIRSHNYRDDISRAWSVAWIEKTDLATPAMMARHDSTAFWILSSGDGVLGVARSATEHVQAIPFPSASPFTLTWIHDVRPPSSPAAVETPFPLDKLGFGLSYERVPAWKHTRIGAGEQYWSKEWYLGLAFPYWSLVLPLAFVLAWQPLKRKWKQLHTRLSPNDCPVCAYDLRAHTIGQRCPECGTAKGSILVSGQWQPPPTGNTPAA